MREDFKKGEYQRATLHLAKIYIILALSQEQEKGVSPCLLIKCALTPVQVQISNANRKIMKRMN